jgi:predicted alpha/beta hydrolase family esterase
MKQQVLVIHGGATFDSYKEYLSFLKKAKISLDDLRPHRDWKDSLPKKLGVKFDVFSPSMPNKKDAKYLEWKIWFERIIPLLNKNAIFVGYSMGGIFLAKYFSENIISNRIKATILVAAPFDTTGKKESLGDFRLPKSLKNFAKQSKSIYLIQSKDDPSVPFENVEKYQKALPNAKTLIFKNKGHFRLETFPEIIKLIKTISSGSDAKR